MQFYDSVSIIIQSGKGGDGCVSTRREKYIAYGGPNGGNGGRGGSIIFQATHNEMTLLPYKQNKQFKANAGMPGQTKEMYGQGAEDLILKVPCGTLIKDSVTGKVLAHLMEDGASYTALHGGRGGVGNMHFKTSQKQFADFALLGEPGQKKELILELMLLADIALIGTPSVGKSSLINLVSDVKAKTADYPFTTIVPNLGMISHKGKSFSMIDVPGLIEGASEGKGLGNEFLRHILKSRIFVFCIDSSRFDTGLAEFPLLFAEIQQYLSHRHGELDHSIVLEQGKIARYISKKSKTGDHASEILYKKYIIPLLTKIDTIGDASILELLKSQFSETIQKTFGDMKVSDQKALQESIQQVSIVVTETSEKFLDHCISFLDDPLTFVVGESDVAVTIASKIDRRMPEVEDITDKEMDHLIDGGYLSETDKDFVKIWSINHPEIAYLSFVTPWGNSEAEIRYWQTLSKEGYLKSYEKAGARKGDVFKIRSWYEGQDDKYILWD